MRCSLGLALIYGLPWLLAAVPQLPPPYGGQPRSFPRAQTRSGRSQDSARGADFDRVYSGVVNLSTEEIYSFNYTSKPGKVDAVRVYVNSSSENLKYPVLFVVRQQKGVLSWQVPLLFRGLNQRTYNYQEVSRTLCPSEPTNETRPSEQLIFVDVASMAPLGAQYNLLVTKIKNFQLQTNVAFHFTASPSQPQNSQYLDQPLSCGIFSCLQLATVDGTRVSWPFRLTRSLPNLDTFIWDTHSKGSLAPIQKLI